RSLEARAESPQDRKARLREPGAPLEVENSQELAELPVGAGLEREGPGLAPAPHLDVVVRRGADRHRGVRDVREPERQLLERELGRAVLALARPDDLADPPRLLDRLARVGAAPLRLGDRLRCPVPPRTELVELLGQPAPPGVDLAVLRQRGGR